MRFFLRPLSPVIRAADGEEGVVREEGDDRVPRAQGEDGQRGLAEKDTGGFAMLAEICDGGAEAVTNCKFFRHRIPHISAAGERYLTE